jgi:tyrosine-protein kinase Etk/Wzc
MTGDPKTVGWRDLLVIAGRRRRFFLWVVLVFLLGTALLSLIMPRVYNARSTLLPPVQASRSIPGLSEMAAPLGILGLEDQSGVTAKLFAQILRSRTVMEGVVDSQNLLDWFRLRPFPKAVAMERAVTALSGASSFSVNQAGILTVTVSFATGWFAESKSDQRTRQLAADVANQFVQQLDQINREKSLSRAKQTRLYLERQLQENEQSIRALSADLAQFQRGHGAVALDAQTKALITTASELQSRLLAKEVELGVAAQIMTRDNPAQIRLQQEADALRKMLNGMEGAADGAGDSRGQTWMGLAAAEIPDLQYQLARYERELRTQVLLQTYLNQQYYQAKIQEASDAPTIQVLDLAVPPQERTSPKRKIMVVAGAISGLIAAVAGTAFLEMVGSPHRRGPEA